MAADHVQPAFGGALGALFRHQAAGVRLGFQGDVEHLLGRRHFEIQRRGDVVLEPRHVLVADMAAILAQMRGNAVGAGLDRHLRRAQGIGQPAAARVAQGGDMVDVHAEAEFEVIDAFSATRLTATNCFARKSHPITLSTLLTIGSARRRDTMSVRCFRSNTWISKIISRKSGELLVELDVVDIGAVLADQARDGAQAARFVDRRDDDLAPETAPAPRPCPSARRASAPAGRRRRRAPATGSDRR